jgi:glycine hydroxymethyltransferase
MILSKSEHARALDRAVFPGLQGGPHNHTTAAIAVALEEAASDEFKTYARQIIANAKTLAESLLERGFRLITGGTDNHLILIDVTPKGLSGKQASSAMQKAGLETNSNSIPFDPRKPLDPSGVRVGTAAVTSRGMKEGEMRRIAAWMDQAVRSADDEGKLAAIRAEVQEFCRGFPCPGIRT